MQTVSDQRKLLFFGFAIIPPCYSASLPPVSKTDFYDFPPAMAERLVRSLRGSLRV